MSETKLDFEMLEEVAVKGGSKEVYSVKAPDATLNELVDMAIDFERDCYSSKLIKFHINKTDENGKNISRSVFFTVDPETGNTKCIFGQVLMSEFAGRRAYCSTCEQISYYNDPDAAYAFEVTYYITLDEPVRAKYIPPHIEEKAEPITATDWKMAEEITPFSIPCKGDIIKEFTTKFLAKMDDLAPQRRGDVKPQTPWESYLLARDDMMCAILEILLED